MFETSKNGHIKCSLTCEYPTTAVRLIAVCFAWVIMVSVVFTPARVFASAGVIPITGGANIATATMLDAETEYSSTSTQSATEVLFYYAFDVPAGSQAVLGIAFMSTTDELSRLWIDTLDADGKPLPGDGAVPGKGYFDHISAATGRYLIRNIVTNASGGDRKFYFKISSWKSTNTTVTDTNVWQLKVNLLAQSDGPGSGDAPDVNSAARLLPAPVAGAITVLTGTIGMYDQFDWYKLDVKPGQQIIVTTTILETGDTIGVETTLFNDLSTSIYSKVARNLNYTDDLLPHRMEWGPSKASETYRLLIQPNDVSRIAQKVNVYQLEIEQRDMSGTGDANPTSPVSTSTVEPVSTPANMPTADQVIVRTSMPTIDPIATKTKAPTSDQAATTEKTTRSQGSGGVSGMVIFGGVLALALVLFTALFFIRGRSSPKGQNGNNVSADSAVVTQKIRIAKVIEDRFSSVEIDDMCFKLGIEPENIVGTTKLQKARELVEYISRRDRIPELVSLINAERSSTGL